MGNLIGYGDTNQDIIHRPSESESNIANIAAVLPIVFCIIVLFNVPSWFDFSGAVYFVVTLILILCTLRLMVTLRSYQPGNTFMRITSNGFCDRSLGNSYELSWDAISKFLVEDDEVLGSDSFQNIVLRRVQRLYVITLNNQVKLSIDCTFNYEALDLAVLLSRKMAKSLDLPSYQYLLTVVDMKRGNPI